MKEVKGERNNNECKAELFLSSSKIRLIGDEMISMVMLGELMQSIINV